MRQTDYLSQYDPKQDAIMVSIDVEHLKDRRWDLLYKSLLMMDNKIASLSKDSDTEKFIREIDFRTHNGELKITCTLTH